MGYIALHLCTRSIFDRNLIVFIPFWIGTGFAIALRRVVDTFVTRIVVIFYYKIYHDEIIYLHDLPIVILRPTIKILKTMDKPTHMKGHNIVL